MKIGQPIKFELNGTDVTGVVKEMLPAMAGVIAYSLTADGMAVVKVDEPHKIRDPKEMTQVLAMYQHLDEVKEFIGQAISQVKQNKAAQAAAKPAAPPKTEQQLKSTFEAALAAFDDPMAAISLHGMGVKGADLPVADKTTTPVDKMFISSKKPKGKQ